MPTLLFVTNAAYFFTLHRLHFAKAAKDKGYKVYVACPPDREHIQKFLDAGLNYVPIAMDRKGMNPFGELSLFWSLLRLYRTVRPDIVHLNTIKPVIYGGIAARLARVPACVSLISGLGYVFINQGMKGKLLRCFVKPLYKLAFAHPNQRVVFQNPDDQRVFITWGLVQKQHTVLIRGSGVDIKQFYASPMPHDVTPKVLLIGRMLKDKGVEEFVRAATLLKDRKVNVECILVGEIDHHNPAAIGESKLLEWHNAGLVQWLGYQHDIASIIRKAYAVCLPSYREGLPNVLLQAAASARPMIATDVPGCREVIDHGINGFLVPIHDHEAIANAIELLVSNPDRAMAMGLAARQKVEAFFSVEKVVEQMLKVYDELLLCNMR